MIGEGRLIALVIVAVFTMAFVLICGKGCHDAEKTAMYGEMVGVPILWAMAGVIVGIVGLATAFYILLGD